MTYAAHRHREPESSLDGHLVEARRILALPVPGGPATSLDVGPDFEELRWFWLPEEVAAAVGYVEVDDGSILVAAGGPASDWALNLAADPRCTVIIGATKRACIAEPLDGAGHARAVRDLILRY